MLDKKRNTDHAVDLALEMIAHGMDRPLAIWKAAYHCDIMAAVVASAMGKRSATKRATKTEPPEDAFWMR